MLYGDADIVIRNREVAPLGDDGQYLFDAPMRPCTIQVCPLVDAGKTLGIRSCSPSADSIRLNPWRQASMNKATTQALLPSHLLL